LQDNNATGCKTCELG